MYHFVEVGYGGSNPLFLADVLIFSWSYSSCISTTPPPTLPLGGRGYILSCSVMQYLIHLSIIVFWALSLLFTLFQYHMVNYITIMTLSLVLFLIGILGFILNRKNIILMIISIEIMLLAVTLLALVSSYQFDDIMGQTYAVYIIAIAGAESAIGLGILVAYYRLRGNISLRS